MSKLKKLTWSFAGILLTAGSALAEGDNNVTSNLGPASGVAGDLMFYLKWGSIFVAIATVLILWIRHNLAAHSKKVGDVLQIRDDMKQWFIMGLAVIVSFIFLFQYIIPQLDKFI